MYERFEELLKKNKVTASDVSRETGVPRSTFTDWKKGRSTPKFDKLVKIANYFGVPVEYIVGGQKSGYSTRQITAIKPEIMGFLDLLMTKYAKKENPRTALTPCEGNGEGIKNEKELGLFVMIEHLLVRLRTVHAVRIQFLILLEDLHC